MTVAVSTAARLRTERVLRVARDRFGEYHPATFAAYGRAFVAWSGRVRPPRLDGRYDLDPTAVPRDALCSAYTVAQLRAYGEAGAGNRSARRARAARTDRKVAA